MQIRKVYKRMTPKAQFLLDDLDTRVGSMNHAYANISNLDLLCSKTACKQPTVANELLEWTLHGFVLGAVAENMCGGKHTCV